jgi:SAM-dependent methyltransferase
MKTLPAAMLLAPALQACAHGAVTGPCPDPHGHAAMHGQHGAAATGDQPGYHHRFEDPALWAQRFESPERDAWQRPDLLVSALSLAPDARVADVGAGTGYFSVRLARAVPQGRVWAVDVEPAMVRWVLDRARRERIANLTAVLAAPDDALLPEPVDLVLVVDTYHHIDARTAYFTRLRGSLRPGGRVAIVDFRLDSPEGPPVAMRLAPEAVRAEMEAAGYALAGSLDTLPRQYVLIFRAAQ